MYSKYQIKGKDEAYSNMIANTPSTPSQAGVCSTCSKHFFFLKKKSCCISNRFRTIQGNILLLHPGVGTKVKALFLKVVTLHALCIKLKKTKSRPTYISCLSYSHP